MGIQSVDCEEEYIGDWKTVKGKRWKNKNRLAKWEKIRMKLDSGSVDHTTPPKTLKGVKTVPNHAARKRMRWTAANGTGIRNMG